MQRAIILAGIVLILVGLLWPWIGKIPLGRLPGDIVIDRPQIKIYIPITSMVIVSLLLSFILWLLKK